MPTNGDLLGSIFICLGPDLCGYLSLVDIYQIICSGIFGNKNTDNWKQYFSTTTLLQLYTNSKSIEHRSHLVNVNHYKNETYPIGTFTLFNININDHKMVADINSYRLPKEIFNPSGHEKQKPNKTETLIKLHKLYNNKKEIITKTVSKNGKFIPRAIKCIKPLLGFLFLNIKSTTEKTVKGRGRHFRRKGYSIEQPLHLNLIEDSAQYLFPSDYFFFEDMVHCIDSNNLNIDYNKTVIHYWSNFNTFFHHILQDKIKINQFNLAFSGLAFIDNGRFSFSINNYATFEEMMETEPIEVIRRSATRGTTKPNRTKLEELCLTPVRRRRNMLKKRIDDSVERLKDFDKNDEIQFRNPQSVISKPSYHNIDISKDLKYVLFMPGLIKMDQWYSITIWTNTRCSYSGTDYRTNDYKRRVIIGQINADSYSKNIDNNAMKFIVYDCAYTESVFFDGDQYSEEENSASSIFE